MNVCLGHVQDLFFEYISTTDEFPVVFRFALIRTLNKLLNVQNDLITRWYVKDGEEFYHDDEAANDSTFVEGATECPFDASHISEGADSKDSSMRSGSTYTDPDRERKSGSSSDRMQRQDKSASSNHRTSRKSSRLDLKDVTPSALDGSPTQTNLEIPLHPAQATAKETPEPRSPTTQTKPSRDQNATPRGPIMGPPTGIPYSGLPGTNAATFETKIWSASDAKQKKSPRLPRF
ncbi:hypothetical protein KEM52_002415 [Ascosphaera acerosa]|nr:hypothetical protein KEM52_002415 [Ascosphaera acerosa]